MKTKLSPVSQATAALILGAVYASACYQYVTGTCVPSGHTVGSVVISSNTIQYNSEPVKANGNWENDSYTTGSGSGHTGTKSENCYGGGYYTNPINGTTTEYISYMLSGDTQYTVDNSTPTCS
jgi:hypothetical protein